MTFLIGVDGGGSGTRVVLADAEGRVLGRGTAGAAGLALGAQAAWNAILAAIENAAQAAGVAIRTVDCALGAGLAGVNHPLWRAEFERRNPGFARLLLDSDGSIALRAAHAGAPGVLIAAGTGSVGEALLPDGQRRSVGGWGFPVGDEGSGAWLGLGAVRHAQCALDGRAIAGALARGVWQVCGAQRDTLLAWSLDAGQGAYAALAPVVFECAARDAQADVLLEQAAQALEVMALALDPTARLPVALAGSVATRLAGRCSLALRARLCADPGEAALGALAMLRDARDGRP